jgi:hypothetical protein
MRISELIYVGIKGSVVALNRATGTQVWTAYLKGGDFVNVVVDQGQILATSYGEVFCLDPFTGKLLWHNGLKGFGRGLATIASETSAGNGLTPLMAEKRRGDEQAAAGATAAAMVASS